MESNQLCIYPLCEIFLVQPIDLGLLDVIISGYQTQSIPNNRPRIRMIGTTK